MPSCWGSAARSAASVKQWSRRGAGSPVGDPALVGGLILRWKWVDPNTREGLRGCNPFPRSSAAREGPWGTLTSSRGPALLRRRKKPWKLKGPSTGALGSDSRRLAVPRPWPWGKELQELTLAQSARAEAIKQPWVCFKGIPLRSITGRCDHAALTLGPGSLRDVGPARPSRSHLCTEWAETTPPRDAEGGPPPGASA